MYTDPNGEFIITAIVVGAIVGAYIGGTMANGGDWNPGNWNWSSNNTYLGIFGGAVIGGVSGAAGAAVTSAVSASIGIGGFAGGAISGFAGGAASGFLSGYGMAGLPGGSGNPWRDGFKGALWGGFMGAGINGVVQGVVSWKSGANFWNGKQPVPIAPKPETSVISEIEVDYRPLPENSNLPVVDDRIPFEKGQEGLRLNNIQQNTERIESLTRTAKYRIPDEMIRNEFKVVQIGEVKNYSFGRTVSYTKQLQDFIQYSNQNQTWFQLYVPHGVKISQPLQNAINQSKYALPVKYY